MVEKRLDVSDRTPLPKGSTSVTIEAVLVVYHLLLQVYQQIFGTAMGSPVLVVVANIIMEHIEDLALSMSPVPTVFWKMMSLQQYQQTRLM